MQQTVYTRISKSIGTQGDLVDLPTKEKAESLFKEVTEKNSVIAFREVFVLYRHGKTPETLAQEEVSAIISEAFSKGSTHFRKLTNEL